MIIYVYIWRVHRRVLSERVRVSDLTLCFPSGLSLLTHVLLYIYIITLSERTKYNTAQTECVIPQPVIRNAPVHIGSF